MRILTALILALLYCAPPVRAESTLPEAKRREIFIAIVKSEDKANKEAEVLFPTNAASPNYKQSNLVKNMDHAEKTMKEYQAKLRAKYQISEKQQSAISREGLENGWIKELGL